MKMNDLELLNILKAQIANSIRASDEFAAENRKLYDSYEQKPYGNELEGRSQVVASDHYDLVESDMPALARIFLGSNKILHFKPFGQDDAEEARQKTEYAHYLIRGQKDSFKTIHDWLKEPGFAKISVVKFYSSECEKPEYVKYEGLSSDEFALIAEDLKKLDKVQRVEIEAEKENDNETFDVKFRVIKKEKRITIANVPVESFLISKGATSKDDAPLVGDVCVKRKGDLVAEGYSKDLVKKLPVKGMSKAQNLGRRYDDKTGVDLQTGVHWTNDEVEIEYLYPLVDYDNDGIPERRMIVKVGDQILENEPYGMVPYAILSQLLMPQTVIGKSRGEQAARIQLQKTAIERGIMDNIYAVNRPRMAIDDSAGSIDGGKVDLDDLMTHQIDGVIRVDGAPGEALMPIVTPYVGESALQIVQYIDAKKGVTLGNQASIQGLSADQFYRETATRFEGVQDMGQAKIELVARVYAETGFRQLFEGVIWTAQHYQDDATEIMVLGKQLMVDPSGWKHEHYAESAVGVGAGDSEQAITNLGAQLATQLQLASIGSPIIDQKKIYNTLDDLARAMGKADTSRYFNDPEIPQQTLMAMLEQAMAQIGQLQQAAQQNPLAEAELIKAKARMAEVTGKESSDMQKFMLEMQRQQTEFAEKMQLEMAKLRADNMNKAADRAVKLTDLSLSNNTNLPGDYIE